MIHSKMTDEQGNTCLAISEDCGRYVGLIIYVTSDGSDFSICRAYEEKIQQLNLTLGSMERDNPRGLANRDRITSISKWGNIPDEAMGSLDGFVLCEDNRNGTQAFICLLERREREDEVR